MSHILAGLLEYATSEQGIKSITKALKEGGKDTLDRVIRRMCEPAKRYISLSTLRCSCTNVRAILQCAKGHDRRSCLVTYRQSAHR